MCGIFGLLDYKQKVSSADKNNIIRRLAIFSQMRGMDASGYGFTNGTYLDITKSPGPAYQSKVEFKEYVVAITGHDRLATKRNKYENQNNHPFFGYSDEKFALAHNGILFDCEKIRRNCNLKETDISTDSYLLVQLLETYDELNLQTVNQTFSELTGTFALSILKESGELFLVKENNPLVLVHFPEMGLYVYASTNLIFNLALHSYLRKWSYQYIKINHGEIIRIRKDGTCTSSNFKRKPVTKIQQLGYLIGNALGLRH